jgi:hypothetical protein
LETKRLPGSATPSAIPGFARRALLLVVAVVLTGAALSPQAVFSSTTIVWYASAVMIFVSFVNASHIVCSWQIFYRNPVIQAKYRSRYLAEFVLLPVLYISAFVFATVKVYEIFPEMRFLLFLLVFEGPIFAHHVASQDRGVLAILTADSPAGDYSWVKRFFYPASVLLFSFIYLRPIYLDQGITTTFGNAWLPLLENVFVLCCTAGLGAQPGCGLPNQKTPFLRRKYLLSQHSGLVPGLDAPHFQGRNPASGDPRSFRAPCFHVRGSREEVLRRARARSG